MQYKEEDIDIFIAHIIQENPQMENFKVLSTVSKQFCFADAAVLKEKVAKATEKRVVEKPVKEDKKDKAPIPDGPVLMPLE